MDILNSTSLITTAIIAVVLVVLIALVIRNIVCWYFKINRLVDQQEQLIALLKGSKIFAQLLKWAVSTAAACAAIWAAIKGAR